MKKKEEKIFVLDTNVLLHDGNSIIGFGENHIMIPITVLEELDNFKKGQEEKNVNARNTTRIISEITKNKMPTSWIPRGVGLGKFKISLETTPPEEIRFNLNLDVPDNRILAAALQEKHLEKNGGKREVVFVTKDSNLRIKAQAYGLKAEDYLADYVEVKDVIESSIKEIQGDIANFILELYSKGKGGTVLKNEIFSSKRPADLTDGYFILKSGKSNALVHGTDKTVQLLERTAICGIISRNSEQVFSMHSLKDSSKSLIALTGKAGTGKTLLALATSIEKFLEEKTDNVLLARPIVSMSNKDIGFLPGDVDEKIDPYMQPLYDNLEVIKRAVDSQTREKIDTMKKIGSLEILPLAFIRGRSISSSIMIIDEAQNLTPHEVKTIITRAGEGTRIIFTGDIKQIDNNYLSESSNGLSHLIDRMKGQPFFSHIHLEKGERSSLASIAAELL